MEQVSNDSTATATVAVEHKPLKILAIVGSRFYDKDKYIETISFIKNYLKKYSRTDTVILSGGAGGTDRCAKQAAMDLKFRYLEAPAFWHPTNITPGYTDKSAGPHRNTTIAMVCTEALVLWNGTSTGTLDVLKKLEQFGKKPVLVKL